MHIFLMGLLFVSCEAPFIRKLLRHNSVKLKVTTFSCNSGLCYPLTYCSLTVFPQHAANRGCETSSPPTKKLGVLHFNSVTMLSTGKEARIPETEGSLAEFAVSPGDKSPSPSTCVSHDSQVQLMYSRSSQKCLLTYRFMS